jgi:hypothetical protein
MPTPTTNYSFNLPVAGGDDDVWGGLLNANWVALDTQLFSGTIGAATTGNAATATLATLATDATTLATPRDFTIGATARSFDGSANVTWSLTDIGIVLADKATAEAGINNTEFMTPLRTNEAIAALAPAPAQLTQTQAEDPASTVFGTVSGQRLEQQTNAAFNVTGSAPKFACRAWVNFDGTLASGNIRASGNVSSVTRTATGYFAVNFTTNMPDANYVATVAIDMGGSQVGTAVNLFSDPSSGVVQTPTTSSFRVATIRAGVGGANFARTVVSVFR